MGKGRDKRKKHEDPAKALKRMEKQAAKLAKGAEKATVDAADGTNLGGLNNEEDVAVLVAKFKKSDLKRRNVEEKEVPHPPPRANAMIVKHPTRDNEIVMFGGEVWDGATTMPFADLLIYNTAKQQWRQLFSPGGPSPRSSCQLWTYKQFVFAHGGEFVSPSQSQYLHFRDCFRLDMNTGVWDQLAAGVKGAGACPSARSGHRVALWKRSAVLFGGFYDNALEVRYYDDLWILSDLEGNGQWKQLVSDQYAEKPHARSGHSIAVHNDDVFVYGGFFTHKASRFQRAEATVFHDLWTINVASATPLWTKIRLAGIPPPIRAGVGFAAKDKRIFFFGGVVDVDGAGGRTLSNFTNDIFVFNMETKKFFPLLLKGSKAGPAAAKDDDAATGGRGQNSLAAEVAAVLGREADADEDDDDDFTDVKPTGPQPLTAEGLATLEEPKTSEVTLPNSAVVPCPRMNAMLTLVDSNTLVVIGGQYETGKKEVTLHDVYTLNVNRADTFHCQFAQDLTKMAWKGEETEASGSWEDGSTVMDVNSTGEQEDGDEEYDDEEYDDDAQAAASTSATAGKGKANDAKDSDEDSDSESDSDDEPPAATSKLAAAVQKASASAAKAVPEPPVIDCDSRTNIKGKPSLQKHKFQLEQQLSASNAVPAPKEGETAMSFFDRTKQFWLEQAAEVHGIEVTDVEFGGREVRRDAVNFAKMRFTEAVALMAQLKEIEEQLRMEKEVIKAHLEAKRKAREAAEAEEEAEGDDDEAPAAVPA